MRSDYPRTYMPPVRNRAGQQSRRASVARQQARRPHRNKSVKKGWTPAEVQIARRQVLFCLYGVLGLELIVAAFTSPVMEIKRIMVMGTSRLPAPEAQVVQGAVSLNPKTNWLRAPIKNLEQQLHELPFVRGASVSRKFPNGLAVQVIPREPVAVAQVGLHRYEVDAERTPIRLANLPSSRRLPVVELQGNPPVTLGKPLLEDGLKAGLEVFRALRATPSVRVAKIVVDQTDNLCLNMQDRIKVYYGHTEELAEKIRLTQQIFQQEPQIADKLCEINLSCPSAPVGKPWPLPESLPELFPNFAPPGTLLDPKTSTTQEH